MKKIVGIILGICIYVLCSSTANAYDLAKHVVELELQNGMKWFLVRRTEAPVFSGAVMVRVGGADEVEGKTGLAHMFEHMAFKGSKQIGTSDYAKERPLLDEIEKAGAELTKEQQAASPDKAKVELLSKQLAKLQQEAGKFQVRNEVWDILVRNGAADLNAYTSKDVTTYHASMPVNRMELWARVTADMIFDPVFREFYTERSVIAEERRAGVENDPDGAMAEKILSTAYKGGPYHWSTIGFEKDVLGLTIADAREFHKKYYVPSNMVGALVGDFNIDEAKRIIERTFGKYPMATNPPKINETGIDVGGHVERFGFNAEPSLAIAYHKPTLPNTDEYVFDVITSLLCDSMSSRLEKRLVYEKKMAEEISCSDSYPGSRLNNLFLIWIEPIKGYAPDEIQKEVSLEIERLSKEPVSEDEMKRVRKNVTSSFIFSLEQMSRMAHEIALFETVFNNWRLLLDYPKNIEAVSRDDVLKVAQKYFKPENRIVVERIRKSK